MFSEKCSTKFIQLHECLIPYCTIIIGHFHGAFCLCVKQVFVWNHLLISENVFHLQVHFHVNQTHFIWKVLHEDSFWGNWKFNWATTDIFAIIFLHIPCKLGVKISILLGNLRNLIGIILHVYFYWQYLVPLLNQKYVNCCF